MLTGPAKRPNLVLLCLIGIALAAAVLRFVQLDYAPSGGHGDVSWIGINAIDWTDRGIVPFYIRELYSPEFFPIYATGILTSILGVSYLPQRIVTAAMGVLMVVLLYPMTYWLLGKDRDENFRQRAGLFAALAGALSLHVVGMHRVGMESPPFMTTIALLTWLTAWAWHRDGEPGSRTRWILAGAALGLNQYVYLPARLLPVLAALWMGYLLVSQFGRFRASLRGWVTMAFVSFLVTLPALILFIYAPEAFSGRADSGTAATGGWVWLYDTSEYGGMFGLIFQKLILTARGVVWEWHGPYSFMGLPILSPVFAVGIVIGVLMAVRSWGQIAFAWSFLGILTMLFTGMISGAVLEVHALHQMGAVPFFCAISGIGLAWLWGRLTFEGLPWAGPVLRGALIVGAFLPAVLNMAYYLNTFIPAEYADPEWSWRKAQTDVDLGRYVSAHTDSSFLLPYSEYIRSDVAWTLADGFRQRASAIDNNGMLHVENPPDTLTVIRMTTPDRPRHDGYPARPDDRLWVLLHDGTVYLLPPLTDDQVDAVLADGEDTPLIDASGTTVATFVTMPTPVDLFAARQVIETPVDALYEGRVRLRGYTAPTDELQPGQTMHVTLYWQVLEPLSVDYEAFAQLWTDGSEAISVGHLYPYSGMYRSRIWSIYETVATHHYLEVPQDAAPGRYTLIGGLFRYLLNQGVQATGENADPSVPLAHLGVLRIPRQPDAVEAAPIPPIPFGGLIQISGIEITQNGVPLTGETIDRAAPLNIRITWEALAAMPADFSLFVHLTESTDTAPAAQLDSVIGGSYPTGIWREGERLTADYTLAIPDGVEAGTYQLVIGVYDWRSFARLPLPDGKTAAPLLDAVTVEE